MSQSSIKLRTHPSLWYSWALILIASVLAVIGVVGSFSSDPYSRDVAKWVGILSFWPLIVTAYRHFSNTYTITDTEVEVNHGIIARNTSAVRIKDLRNIGIKQGIIERIVGIGDVVFSSAATDGAEVIFRGVKKPTEIRNLVDSLRD